MKKKKTRNKKDMISLMVDDVVYSTRANRKYTARAGYKVPDPDIITSFMPGNIQKVFVRKGQKVEEGQELCILEAMKMKNVILAPREASIKKVNVKEGDMVPKNHVLVELKK